MISEYNVKVVKQAVPTEHLAEGLAQSKHLINVSYCHHYCYC